MKLKTVISNDMSKIATDLKQSERLAKILPIESADMFYGTIAPYEFSDRMYDGGIENIPLPKISHTSAVIGVDEYDGEIPAWSLAKLMDVLPQPAVDDEGTEYELIVNKEDDSSYSLTYRDAYTGEIVDSLDTDMGELLDVAVEMIIKLKERKLL